MQSPTKKSNEKVRGKKDGTVENLYWETLEKVWKSQQASIDLMKSIPSAIFICRLANRTFTILDCNPVAERLVGKAISILQGTELGAIWTQANEKEIIAQLLYVEKSGIPFELQEVRDAGTEKERAFNIKIFRMAEDLLGVLFDDITSLKRAEKLLQEEILKLQELDEMKNNFIATTSHELRTPLVSVCGAVEFMLDRYRLDLPDDVVNLAEMINRGTTRLKHLVNALLDLSRIQDGRLSLEAKSEDIIPIIKRVIEDQAYRVESRDQKVSFDGPDTFEFMFDALRIEQVLTNLLTNAMKNTPPGGKITISLVQEGDTSVIISVSDTGIGITEEERPKLFTKFGKINRENLNASVDIQGTGIGLYLTKTIIDLHRGEIWVESEGRDMGTTFKFKLPMVQPEASGQCA
jgi:signal transduction histidine kinase